MSSSEWYFIQFEDGVYYVTNYVKIQGEHFLAKWKRTWYPAKILYCGDKAICHAFKNSIGSKFPQVSLKMLKKLSSKTKHLEQNEFQKNIENNKLSVIPAEKYELNGVDEFKDFEEHIDDLDMDPNYIPDSDHSDNSSIDGLSLSFGVSEAATTSKDSKILQSADVCDKSLLNTIELDSSVGAYSPLQINVIPSSSSTKCKQFFCYYCHKLVTKFARHLENAHKDEPDVKNIVNMNKDYKKRLQMIAEIRKKGNFIFNTQHAFNNGSLIVSRRPQAKYKRNVNEFKPCPICKGFYSINSIRRHYRKCNPNTRKGDRNLNPLSSAVLGNIHKKASEMLRKVFSKLRNDSVTDIIRYDELAIIYGNYLCIKYRKPHFHPMIRSKLRLIGRLLISLKEIDSSVTDFAFALQPTMYDNIIHAVNVVAMFNGNANYKAPATASAIGTLLKKCSKILINEYIKKDLEDCVRKTKNFLSILEEDYACSINKTVEENQCEIRRLKQINLPDMHDVKLFNEYLEQQRINFYDSLKSEFKFETWKSLAEYTLTSVQIFNRRRAGEIERLTIQDFNAYQRINENLDGDIFQSLTEESKSMAKQYVRFEIRGKLGRNVPVLLHNKLLQCLKLIIYYRKKAGVTEKNPYLFGLPGGDDHHLSACVLIRKFSSMCGAKNPSSLRGTELRKHLATRSVLLNLEDQEVSDLANFLGHAEKIHKEHYRIPIVTRDIVRMSRLLEIAQGETNHSNDCEVSIPEYSQMDSEKNYSSNDVSRQELSFESSEREIKKKIIKKRSKSPVGHVKRLSWSADEKKVVLEYFHDYIKNKKLPTTESCSEAIRNQSELKTRSPLQLKSWISNEIKKNSNVVKRKRGATMYWSAEEIELMRQIFSSHLAAKKMPSFSECSDAISKHPLLKLRKKETVKAWVYNEIRKNK